MSAKVLVVGLDGATWDVMIPLLEEGIMPNLSKLIEEGTSGKLISSIPPQTAPAWTGFLTGVNPGKHGVFDFVQVDKPQRNISLVNSRSIRVPTIWDILSHVGMKSISINVPMTYPPKEVNGILIGGILSPEVGPQFVYPQELYKVLQVRFPNYEILDKTRLKDTHLELFIKRHIDVERMRFELATHLMKSYDWQVFMVHNQSLDGVQHACWNYIARRSDGWEKVRTFYQASDKFLGKLLKRTDKETNIIILSDHGFGPLEKIVHLNFWLKKKGYLIVQKGLRPLIADIEDFAKRIPLLKNTAYFVLNKIMKHASTNEQLLRAKLTKHLINWHKTAAFLIGGWPYGNIYINAKGQKREKLAKELIQGIKELKDPEHGDAYIVDEIYPREKIYKGPCTELAPDLVVKPAEGYCFFSPITGQGLLRDDIIDHFSGTHRPEGILIIKGPQVCHSGQLLEANIVDLLPTILALLDVDIPTHVDGQVLNEVFIDKPKTRKREYKIVQDQAWLGDNEETVRKRLEDLGYM